MSQNPSRPCPRCGTPLPVSQRFCTNCGALQDASTPGNPTIMSANDLPPSPPTVPSSTPPPPPYQQGMQPPPYTGYDPGQAGQQWQQRPMGQQQFQPPYQPVPPYARSNNNNNAAAGIIGTIIGLLLLRKAGEGIQHWFAGCFAWLLIILAIISCVFFARIFPSSSHSTTTSTSNRSHAATPTSPVKQTGSPINATVTYSVITMTFVDAQQAPTFADDTRFNEGKGLLRLNFKEQTGAIEGVYFNYQEEFRLIAPGGTTISAHAVQHLDTPAQSISRTNWVDFPITQNIDVSKYTLRIGNATETQIDIPLTGKADLAKYQPRKATPNTKFTYGGVEFIITQVTATLSSDGPQAPKDKTYVVVNLTINNNSTHAFYGGLTDMRLRSGTTTSPPLKTFDTVEAGQTNVQHTVTFVMPQDSTDFTLIFLPSAPNQAPTQATANFQIP
ncbi:MAG: DUF4352 domain-containing protein [Ktedonobacteraceae bacterium]|nr:DUF4352 domain-containing protein [Ktedonobacteraceae bacterium]